MEGGASHNSRMRLRGLVVDHKPPRSGENSVEWLSDVKANRGKTPCSNEMTVRRLPHPLLILKSAVVGNIHPKTVSDSRHGRIPRILQYARGR
jgi:hypothetical protein